MPAPQVAMSAAEVRTLSHESPSPLPSRHSPSTVASTRGGTLDAAIDDPLNQPDSSQPPPPRLLSPTRRTRDHDDDLPAIPPKDFSFLKDAYHAVATPTTTPVDALLRSGQYRLAAQAAARNIREAPPTDSTSLFHLLHIRLACLCLVSEHALAAQESHVLGDLNSAFYRHPLTNAHIVPWDLRLLIVRLAALGYGEWRKGIMGYYELAQECRDSVAKCDCEAEKQLWRTRLRDCGIRVANLLVEMADLEGAGQLLSSLSSKPSEPSTPDTQQILYMEALVWLRIGDTTAATRCIEALSSISTPNSPSPSPSSSSSPMSPSSPSPAAILPALLNLASSDYESATSSFRALHDEYPSDAMVAQNLAVCLLYTGHISSARDIFSELAETTPPFHSLVFNLCTVYELCTERSRELKVGLAEKLAERAEQADVGWEISNAAFKL